MVKIRKMSVLITSCVSSCRTIRLKLHRIILLSHAAVGNCNFPSRTIVLWFIQYKIHNHTWSEAQFFESWAWSDYFYYRASSPSD